MHAPETPAVLTLTGLRKSFPAQGGSVPVLAGVSLRLADGETLALTGESGSGKSTLLHLIAGLDRADAGTITVAGQDVTAMSEAEAARLRRRTVAMIFQAYNLIPSMTVAENLAFHARLAGRFDPRWTDELAARLGLAPLAGRMPDALSGGQRQRVAIGRAMALRPRLLLADEPTGSLDEDTAERMMAALRDLVADTGCALLMVTHSPRLAAALDRRVHLSHGRVAAA
ncbi:ABC transporter ATP-binding protein [Paracoccus contaminans]|uniref:ABC transporter ATP-binding protein n=1 Tax=Paracoccus contaminans TaxID=1945662 RepID=A0A1W6CW52_9RHOB|nr:ABC transporter ATP-binding protein [Paracoccus contaminans]ARJ69102.1 ABC transporter ATP-binding protein [Paracoccus contaminans]